MEGSSIQWLNNLGRTQLKSFAVAIGINSSGTKPALITQLQNHLLRGRFTSLEHGQGASAGGAAEGKTERREGGLMGQNIISIDMGIRNLAYCRFQLPSQTTTTTRPLKPSISEWSRLNVSLPSASDTAAEDEDETQSNPAKPKVKEGFDLHSYAGRAYTLIHSLLYSSPHTARPTHILIERQRFRSMGGNAVQEWTLRVNMFEAMLYTVLETLRREGKWIGIVEGISPGRVGRFWLGEDGAAHKALLKGEEKAKKSATNKMLKVHLVGNWLKEKDMFELEGKARGTAERYLRKMEGRGREETLGKLDDLADCLIQGMTWSKWEDNRRMIYERGEDALNEVARG